MEIALNTQSHAGAGIRAFVAEDSAAISERLIALLTEGGEITVVGEAISADAAIEQILTLRPDIMTVFSAETAIIELRVSFNISTHRKIRTSFLMTPQPETTCVKYMSAFRHIPFPSTIFFTHTN
jgi:DNA-binding NarL/FixJ family response regulator